MLNRTWSSHARKGRAFRHMHLVFMACEGLIELFDGRDDTYCIILPDDLTFRANELANTIGTAPSDGNAVTRSLYKECKQAVVDMKDCVKEAKAMGDPSDPQVRAFWARHKPGSKSTVSLSPGRNRDGYPTLPSVGTGRYTGRTAAIDGRAVIPDNQYRLHQPPRRKNQAGLILSTT